MENRQMQQEQKGNRSRSASGSAEVQSEGKIAKFIERRTAQIPSDIFLWSAGLAIAGSLALQYYGMKKKSLFVGQWVPSLLIMGVYNKIVKVAGSDRTSAGQLLH